MTHGFGHQASGAFRKKPQTPEAQRPGADQSFKISFVMSC
jgi:hypothetical protein